MKQTNEKTVATKVKYVAPTVEIVEVQTSQNILGGSAPDFDNGGFF